MAVDPGVDFSNNNQESQQPNAAVNQATLVKLVEGLESELLKIKDKVYCLEEKVTFLEKENKQLANMEHAIKDFFYKTESFNEFMFNYVKNYEILLDGLKGYKAENFAIFKNYKDFLNFKKNKNYQKRSQPFNPGQHSYPSSGFWQGNQPFNTGSQNFGQYSTQVHQAASMLMGIAGFNLDFKKAIALVEAALKEANK